MRGSAAVYRRAHHQGIAHVLHALDADVLRANGCWLGGSTCMALRFGEYRESVDIDFMVADAQGWRTRINDSLRASRKLAGLI